MKLVVFGIVVLVIIIVIAVANAPMTRDEYIESASKECLRNKGWGAREKGILVPLEDFCKTAASYDYYLKHQKP